MLLARPQHPLWCALFFSLAAHLAVLGFPTARPLALATPASASPVHALLIDKTAQSAQPQTSEFASISPAHTVGPVSGPTRTPDRTPPVASVPGPASTPADRPLIAETDSAPTVTAQPGRDAQPGDAPEGLSHYHEALRQEARRLKREYDRKYSRIEREQQQGWEGRVEMKVRAGTEGTTVLLARSSNHAALDQEALELLDRAVRRTVLPDALRGKPFVLAVALEFRLNNKQGGQDSD